MEPATPRRAGTRARRRLAKPSPMDAFCRGQRVSAPPSVSAWPVHHGGSFFYRARSFSWSFACRAYFPRIPPTAWLGGATFAVPENARLPGEHRNNPQNQGNTGSTRDSIPILPPVRPGRSRASAAVTDSPTWYSLTSTALAWSRFADQTGVGLARPGPGCRTVASTAAGSQQARSTAVGPRISSRRPVSPATAVASSRPASGLPSLPSYSSRVLTAW